MVVRRTTFVSHKDSYRKSGPHKQLQLWDSQSYTTDGMTNASKKNKPNGPTKVSEGTDIISRNERLQTRTNRTGATTLQVNRKRENNCPSNCKQIIAIWVGGVKGGQKSCIGTLDGILGKMIRDGILDLLE